MDVKRGLVYGLGLAALSSLTACAGQGIKDNDYRKSAEPRTRIERPETQNRNRIPLRQPEVYFTNGMTDQEFSDVLGAYLENNSNHTRGSGDPD